MHRLKLFFRKQVVTRWLLTRGWILFRRGRLERAEEVLEHGVTLAPGSFRMHLLLGRVHLASGSRQKALQELSICYHLDAPRFTRQSFDGALQEEVVLEAQIPSDPDLFDITLREDGPLPSEWDDLLETEEEVGEEVLLGTDFTSVAEYRRFQSLAPLTSRDVASTDLKQLLDQLSSISSHGET